MISTGDLRAVDRRTAQDADRRTGVAELRSTLAGLGVAGLGAARPSVPSGRTGPTDSAGTPATTPGRALDRPLCRTTRAALHDYLTRSLLPSRRRRVEAHLDGCAECTRAFIDVRETSWALRGLGRRLATDDHHGGRHRRTPGRRVVAAGA
ncbi:zf-HC2 domain-containing protein [Promicromonospora sp. NPDC023987]|uniref:zf-HC2 domain-containing protein n=1 Tax=Promicromonospora sp. NPDC023987 TaxID=3155360 RepID=UPI00340613B2